MKVDWTVGVEKVIAILTRLTFWPTLYSSSSETLGYSVGLNFQWLSTLKYRDELMMLAKNYETVSKFVKVMPRILWPLFFSRTRCSLVQTVTNMSQRACACFVCRLYYIWMFVGLFILIGSSNRSIRDGLKLC